jgi:hypothetical protein
MITIQNSNKIRVFWVYAIFKHLLMYASEIIIESPPPTVGFMHCNILGGGEGLFVTRTAIYRGQITFGW